MPAERQTMEGWGVAFGPGLRLAALFFLGLGLVIAATWGWYWLQLRDARAPHPTLTPPPRIGTYLRRTGFQQPLSQPAPSASDRRAIGAAMTAMAKEGDAAWSLPGAQPQPSPNR